MNEGDAHTEPEGDSEKFVRPRAHEVERNGVDHTTDEDRAALDFARKMDWLVFSWMRKARPEEGGESHDR